MSAANVEVVIVGGGCAGMTAAIGLAKAGFAVAVVEAAAYPGAENWSGCVYFCENLAHPDILGPAGVEALAWERRLVERGFFATDGHGLLGMTYRDPPAFRHCYTVLRPIFDHHLAQLAVQHGIALLNDTTAESLIRDGGRVIGVCTNRGPIYADLVYLAEGDASHLVTREGYERYADQREAPKFLQGIKQVIDVPPGVIEETFGVGPEEGVAYELLVRNGTLRGRPVHLNMGGFVYTNRQSLSVGLVLPADHLREHFDGDPHLLLEWFEQLPALQPWLKQGRRGVFGAKLIRGGGARDIPRLVDDGLAIGGAASAIGVDFPYPNFTGPATHMGLLLVQAARRIREEKCRFSQEALSRHYLEPLQKSHYWHDVEFLRRWPGYVKRTTVFFGRTLDLALGSAYLWTRPNVWLPTRWVNALRLVWEVAGPAHWPELRDDLYQLSRALQIRATVGHPGLGRLLLDGTVNALRDFFGSPRPHLDPAGTIRVRYAVAGGTEPSQPPPRLARRWFQRFLPVLASAARRVYSNNTEPLARKLASVVSLLVRQLNILDVVTVGLLGLLAVVSGACLAGMTRLKQLVWRWPGQPRTLYRRYALAARQATDLTPVTTSARQNWEAQLGQLAYQTVKDSHMHVLWPQALPGKNKVARQGLWHVCPAHVYEARLNPQGQLQVVVNFENCIKCETCWRTSDLVDWGRDGRHRFLYPVHSPAVPRLVAAAQAASLLRPAFLPTADWWERALRDLGGHREGEIPAEPPRPRPAGLARTSFSPLPHLGTSDGHWLPELIELAELLTKLERKLEEFEEALAEEPRTIDRARADYLELLARYAQQLASRAVEVISSSVLADVPRYAVVQRKLLELATAVVKRSEERARRTWDRRYHWAAADGRQLRQHHLVGLRRILQGIDGSEPAARKSAFPNGGAPGSLHLLGPRSQGPTFNWLQVEQDTAETADLRAAWSTQLDAVFPALAWRDLDRGLPLTPPQDTLLRDLLAQVPVIDANRLAQTLHPPIRKMLLAELGRRDPALAFRVACHLWARDLAGLVSAGSPFFRKAHQRWASGSEWACFTPINAVQTAAGWQGTALFVPAAQASSLLLLLADQLAILPLTPSPPAAGGEKEKTVTSPTWPGLHIEPSATLGLRGAGLTEVRLDRLVLPEERIPVDQARLVRAWNILSAADLTAIACGMAEVLCDRVVAHATSRVQFPGLFHDEESRDPIGKFGAVKKMVAEMGAQRFLLETLNHVLSPVDFSSPSAERAGLVKALVAECLGTAPGSLTYNAGQVFGGTGFSEDDLFAKFFRDAAAWRFLGQPNVDIWRQHGDELLRSWRPDGQRLASLPLEAEHFEQLTQRKALQAELDEIRVVRSQLRELVNEWLTTGERRPPLGSSAVAEITEALARQDAYLLASKALLLRLHARCECGLYSETELALVRVWLARVLSSLDELEGCVRMHLALARPPADAPIVEPSAPPPVTLYRAYLAAPAPYDSGDFLEKPVDLLPPRLVPEMIDTDPELAASNRAFQELLLGHFGVPRTGGLSYERWIERQHRPDAADLDFCRTHGFFRMPIPRELGGEGRSKVDYYLLTTNCQRLVDVAISLTIQVNTSLGTTPVLLARAKDLPRAQQDLARFADDAALQEEIARKLTQLASRVSTTKPAVLEAEYKELQARLAATVLASAAVKALAHRFVEAWQQAGQAGRDFDLPGMRRYLEVAAAAWTETCQRAPEQREEMARRLEACDLFLRWVAAGQISAFALTEPSAGSDTARVATRAILRSVPVEQEADGVLRFVPVGSKEPRYLLDARKLVFGQADSAPAVGLVKYRWSETAEPAPIGFDEYDYETDDPHRLRYYWHGDRKVYFTDIAQLRPRDGKLWYDYWELTGAKMWITNGRMCGLLCLYAKTAEGITGFLVDRHAEGLMVGKDEAKLGQCGSPTNELSLQAVRVPRENVIGIEGRGQVNALETLNVGRAGLAMSAMAQMAGLIEQSRAFAQAMYGDIPDWVAWRLQRMEEEQFTSEALAYEIIGRFEHPQTKSVRLESAIAKALVSEALHRVIELAEDIHGLAGQTQHYLIEKRKRDARVLTIYEGTNEIQRFFILKDLAGGAWASRKEGDSRKTRHTSREALELEALRLDVRQRLTAARELFGQELWQNPNLQANCFLLSEAVAWLKAAESTLARAAWLQRVASGPSPLAREEQSTPGRPQPAPLGSPGTLATGHWPLAITRAWLHCRFEVRHRLRRFDEELAHLRRGYYAEHIRAASLLFHRLEARRPERKRTSRITRPLSVLVVLEPSAAAVLPQPHLQDGRLVEPYCTWSAADRAALEMALRLRDEAAAPVALQVAAVAPRSAGPVLREALSLGADRARLVVADTEALTPACRAAALAAVMRAEGPFDLVLGGSTMQEEGLVAQLTAEALGVPFAGSATHLVLRASSREAEAQLETGDWQRIRSLPLAVTIEAGLALRPFTVAGYFRGLATAVEVERWPRSLEACPVVLVEAQQSAAEKEEAAGVPLSPVEAARRLVQEIGLGAPRTPAARPYDGPIDDISSPETLNNAAVAVLASDAGGDLGPAAVPVIQAAVAWGQAGGWPPAVLLVVPGDEIVQRRAVVQLRQTFSGPVVLLVTGQAVSLTEGKARLLQECWLAGALHPPLVLGEAWTEAAFAALALGPLPQEGGKQRESKAVPLLALRVRRLVVAKGQVQLETARAQGKLLARQTIAASDQQPCWVTLSHDAEVAGHRSGLSAGGKVGRVQRWAPHLARFYEREDMQRLLQEVQAEAGIDQLADADFIIDVGFGVGNRDGYEAVIEPLEKALRQLGVRGLMVGGSRKVTEELHLLPADRQIGQSGVSVNPRILLAIGISGAPQHLNYIGARATILAFNRDPEAPIMTLNRRQPRPRVFPVIGDLFETVPALIAALRQGPAVPTPTAENTQPAPLA